MIFLSKIKSDLKYACDIVIQKQMFDLEATRDYGTMGEWCTYVRGVPKIEAWFWSVRPPEVWSLHHFYSKSTSSLHFTAWPPNGLTWAILVVTSLLPFAPPPYPLLAVPFAAVPAASCNVLVLDQPCVFGLLLIALRWRSFVTFSPHSHSAGERS